MAQWAIHNGKRIDFDTWEECWKYAEKNKCSYCFVGEAGMRKEIYKGHLIEEIKRYKHGLSDWHVYPENEPGWVESQRSLDQVKNWIDELEIHSPKQNSQWQE